MGKFSGLLNRGARDEDEDDDGGVLQKYYNAIAKRLGKKEAKVAKSICRSDMTDDVKVVLLSTILEVEELGNTPSNKILEIVRSKCKEFDVQFLGTGTSRAALIDGNEVVIKFAHRKLGETDNEFESTITSLIESGHVSKNAGRRIAKTIDISADDSYWFIGEQYYRALGTSEDIGAGRKAINYILEEYNEYKAMIADLASEFVLCDIHPKRPFNIGLGKGDKMVAIDHGLFVPMAVIPDGVKFEGVTFKKNKLHCSCGGELKYRIPKIDGMSKEEAYDAITSRDSKASAEIYTCTECSKPHDCRTLHAGLLEAIV